MCWRSELEKRLTALFPETVAVDQPIRVLEAGGGDNTELRTDFDVDITTIDISEEQLKKNTYASKKICADITSYEFAPRSFNVVFFWDVLEHIENPKAALERASAALDDKGLIVISGPDPNSMKGIVTRFTPHFFHVLFYRHLLKKADAGMPGAAPFPKFLSPDVRPETLKRTLEEKSFSIIYEKKHINHQVYRVKNYSYPIYLMYKISSIVLRAISLNRYGAWETDFILIAQRDFDGARELDYR